MAFKIHMVWKAGDNHPAYGLSPRDRIVELEDGQCLALRSVEQSPSGFVLTTLGSSMGRGHRAPIGD